MCSKCSTASSVDLVLASGELRVRFAVGERPIDAAACAAGRSLNCTADDDRDNDAEELADSLPSDERDDARGLTDAERDVARLTGALPLEDVGISVDGVVESVSGLWSSAWAESRLSRAPEHLARTSSE